MKINYVRILVLLLLVVSAFGELNASMQQSLIESIKEKKKFGKLKAKDTKTVQVLVKIKEGVDAKGAYQSLLKANGIQSSTIEMVKSFSLVGNKIGLKTIEKKYILVLKSNTLTEDELMEQAKQINGAESVEVDEIVHLDATPNDARYPELWGMNNDGTYGTVDADSDVLEAWEIHRGSRDVVVGIIDTGIDYTHEDLVNNIWINPNEIAGNGIDDDNNGYVDDIYGIDAVNNDSDPMEDHYHGTHVAGTIGGEGNNSVGVTGVNWTTAIASCKFMNANGRGYSSNSIECVNYFTDLKVNHGVNIVVTNNSWGGGSHSPILYDAIATAGDNGILFVASAGNSHRNLDVSSVFPASYDLDNVIAVAATNSNDDLAYFSNYGQTVVDLAAPGVDILSTFPSREPNVCTPNDNQVFYFEGFESNLSNWLLNAFNPTNWEEDLPNEYFLVDDSDSFSGISSFSETSHETYTNNLVQQAYLKDGIDLSSVSETEGVCVSFQIKGKLNNIDDSADYFSLDLSGGDGSLYVFINETYEEWTRISLHLPSTYFTNNLRFSFYRSNDETGVESGYNIDDLKISTGDIEVPTSNTYVSSSGTSMAAPHVAGAIALLAAVSPNKTSTQIKEIVLGTVDSIDSLNGVVATGGRLNIHDMLRYAERTSYNDFNGDIYSDILIQNTSNFNLNAWFGSDTANVTDNYLTTLNNETEVLGQGDINGDGFLDIIVENSNTGRLLALRSNDEGIVTSKYLKTLTANQEVIDLADMNGDGYDDIIIKNTVNLRINILLGSADSTVTNQYVKTLNSPQEIVGFSDVNGDGYADIIVKNNNNRRVNAWLSDENATVHNQYLKTLPPTVEIFDVADFNNDGYDDLIVQNSVNLRVNVWLSDENGSLRNQYIKTLSPNLDIAGIADINGDGFPDIVVSNRVNNRVNLWMNNSGTGVTTQYMKTLNTGAVLVDSNDINGDGYDDVIVQNATGRVSAWLGSDTGAVSNQYLSTLSENQEILIP